MTIRLGTRGSRLALKKFRAAMDLIHREGAASVMPIPDDDFACARGPGPLNSGVHFADEDLPRLHVPPLSRQQLFVGIVYTARALEIGHDQNAGTLRKTDRVEQENAEYDFNHNQLLLSESLNPE